MADATTAELARRLTALEDLEAIKQLKYRYFFNCDQKQPDQVRECFADGAVDLDFGRIGHFDNADALVAIFTELACAEHIVEMHHAQNPQITLQGDDQATGLWGLFYYMIDTRQKICTQLGGYYQDRYRKTADGWKITASAFNVTSTQILSLEDGLVKALFVGRTAPREIDDPSRQAG